jgi:flagellar basal body-associated protein FliL
MNINQKGFANIILVIVIVVLVGTIGYFAFVKKSEPVAQQPTPTPATTQTKTPAPTPTSKDETSSWKTYTNTEYGFELKYPATLDSIVVNVTSGSNFYKRYVSVDIDTPAKIAQMKQPNPGSGGNYPLFRFGAFVPKDGIGDLGCGTEPVLKTITIGEVSAKMCGGEDIGAPEGLMNLQFTRDNTTLFSTQSGFYSGSNKQIVDKILATFKFTN